VRGRPRLFVPKATDTSGHKTAFRPEPMPRVRKLLALVEKLERLKKIKEAMRMT
jgi:hypothetical protein